MKNQKGFIQIPLLTIIIASVFVASIGISVAFYKQNKVKQFTANVSELLNQSQSTSATEEIQVNQKEIEQAKLESERAKAETEKLRAEIEDLKNKPISSPVVSVPKQTTSTTNNTQLQTTNPPPSPVENWTELESKYFAEANQKGWVNLIITNSLGEKRYYRKEGTLWVRKNSEAEIQQPYVAPPTTQQLIDLRRFCLSDSFINSVCQDQNFMPGYYSNEKFRLAVDDLIKKYYAILSANEQQKIAAEKTKLDCILAPTPEDERVFDPATQNYLRQIRCGTVTDADRTNYELSRIKSSVDELKYRLDSKISFPSFYLDPIKAPTFSNPRWEIRWEGSGGTVTDSSGNFYQFHCEDNTCRSY
jgi:hypothetical protein